MALRDVIKAAYANAGRLADQARAEGRDPGDLFDIIAAAVENTYGPVIERTIFYEGLHAVVTASWIDGGMEHYQSTRVPGEVHDQVRHDLLRHSVVGVTFQAIGDQHKAGRLPVTHRMGSRVLQLPPQRYGGQWVPNRDEPPA